jgi:hypothetical protein
MGKKTVLKNKNKEKQKTSNPVVKASKAASAKKSIKGNTGNAKHSMPKSDDSKKKIAAKAIPGDKNKTVKNPGAENLKKKAKPSGSGAKVIKNQKDFFTVEDDDEEKEKQEETDYVEETEIEFIEEGSAIEDLNTLEDEEEDEFYGDDDF